MNSDLLDAIFIFLNGFEDKEDVFESLSSRMVLPLRSEEFPRAIMISKEENARKYTREPCMAMFGILPHKALSLEDVKKS